MKTKTCSIDGCNKPAKNSGMCWGHYSRKRRHGDPLMGRPAPVEKISDYCTIDGCNKPVYAFNLCPAHYTRKRRHGSPEGGGTRVGETHEFFESLFSAETDECISWPYAKDRNGYGLIATNGSNQIVSRRICERLYGPPTEERPQAAHSCGCGHLGCVNPRHLRWASIKENHADKIGHGTAPRGENNYNSKLTEEDVRVIRSSKGVSQRELARRFGVSFSQISDIIARKRWGWLD